MCFTETWLKDEQFCDDIDGFTVIRFDRDRQKTTKSKGGGLCIYVNKNWATNYCVRETESTRDYEILTVSFRPFYLPREFGQITVILVYVPGPEFNKAAERIAESYNQALNRSTDQAIFILGDFSRCDISGYLPTLHQYVTCPTRLDRTLDKCFGNIPAAYKAEYGPPLGRSDHNVIHLLPRYRQRLKREKPVTKAVEIEIMTVHGLFLTHSFSRPFYTIEGAQCTAQCSTPCCDSANCLFRHLPPLLSHFYNAKWGRNYSFLYCSYSFLYCSYSFLYCSALCCHTCVLNGFLPLGALHTVQCTAHRAFPRKHTRQRTGASWARNRD